MATETKVETITADDLLLEAMEIIGCWPGHGQTMTKHESTRLRKLAGRLYDRWAEYRRQQLGIPLEAEGGKTTRPPTAPTEA